MKVDRDSYIQTIKSLPHLTLGSYPKKHKQLLNGQMELNHLTFGMIFSKDNKPMDKTLLNIYTLIYHYEQAFVPSYSYGYSYHDSGYSLRTRNPRNNTNT